MEFIETFDTSYRTLQRIRKKRYVKEDIKIAELELLAAMEKERFVKDFFSPDEIVARMVDSLMSCYVGEDTANLYALTDEECGTFRKMTLDGKPMFKKALEKHELGKALLKKGYKPHEIRAMLEYATYYSDGESAHVWPETSVGLVIRDKPKHGKPNKQNRRKTPPKKNERRPRNSL
jgi:hypothetical protein